MKEPREFRSKLGGFAGKYTALKASSAKNLTLGIATCLWASKLRLMN
jgi:hypothetical protein